MLRTWARTSRRSSYSLEIGAHDSAELTRRLAETLARPSDLTPRLIKFFEVLLSEDRSFSRAELKKALFQNQVGADVGQAGRYLSNISQFLTKKRNDHLRQLFSFEGDRRGARKENYYVRQEYRPLLAKVLAESA